MRRIRHWLTGWTGRVEFCDECGTVCDARCRSDTELQRQRLRVQAHQL